MSNNIAGKVVVITGASSGLGEATARLLSAQGASVVLGARRHDRIQSLATALTGRGGKAIAMAIDVTHCEQVKNLVDAAVKAYGRIDVMINNAGLMPQAPLERLKIDEWDRMIDVNIKGVLYGIAAALPLMKEQKAGHIINVSSVAGHKVGPGFAVYAATKHAVRALSEGLRQEVKPYNIRTTVISPGAVATELPNSVTDLAAAVPMDMLSSIEKFSIFMRLLAPPVPSTDWPGGAASLSSGKVLFSSVGCALCHAPTLHTGNASVAALRNQSVKLYSDLLLHDMGVGLADGVRQGQAGPRDFRTAPLWGLGQRIFFLHDGRTSDLRGALQAHQSSGSEANGVIAAYNRLSDREQQDLLNFLRSL